MKTGWIWICAAVVVVVGGAAALMWRAGMWPQQATPVRVEQPEVAAPVAALPPSQPASEPAIRYPVEAASQPMALAGPQDFKRVLDDLFGAKQVAALIDLQEFPNHFVATVDNLGRPQASSRLWPAKPAAGKFTVDGRDASRTIGADNGMRYSAYVLLLENVDMGALAAAYVRAYPLLQQSYEGLGYPGRYFNDRFVQVIDLMLATPDVDSPLKVHLPTLGDAAVQAQRPWVLYEFDDPALQSLSSGQKMLLRMGAVNERRVKAKLVELRRLIAAGTPQR